MSRHALFPLRSVFSRSRPCSKRTGRGSIFWLALAALLHPLMAVYSAIAMLTVAVASVELWRSLCLFYGLGWVLCAAIFLATHHADSNIAYVCPQNPGLKSETWATHLVLSRAALSCAALSRSYFFLSSWKWYEYPGLLIPLLLLGIAGANKHAPWRARALAIAATVMGGCALLVSLCFVHRSGSLLLARLQVLRGFQFVYIAGVLLAGGLLAKVRQRTVIGALSPARGRSLCRPKAQLSRVQSCGMARADATQSLAAGLSLDSIGNP